MMLRCCVAVMLRLQQEFSCFLVLSLRGTVFHKLTHFHHIMIFHQSHNTSACRMIILHAETTHHMYRCKGNGNILYFQIFWVIIGGGTDVLY